MTRTTTQPGVRELWAMLKVESCWARWGRWFVVSCAVGALAGGLGALAAYKWLPKRYASTGMVQVKPEQAPIMLAGANQAVPMFEQQVESQVILLKSERVVDMALMNPSWRDRGRGNSPQETKAFRQNLEISRQGQIILVTFTDEDPRAATDGTKAVISAYSDLYVENERANTEERMKALEGMRDDYTSRLKQYNEKITKITGGLGTDAIQVMYQFKITQNNAGEVRWRDARRARESWEMINGPIAQGSATQPSTNTEAGRLLITEQRMKVEFDDMQAEVLRLGRTVSEIKQIELDVEQARGWLEQTKLQLEQLTITSSNNSRTTILSNGDRPVEVSRAGMIEESTAVAFGGAFALAWGWQMWRHHRKRRAPKPAQA